MGRRNYIARLKAYVRNTRHELKFEGLAANGDRVVYRAVINGHGFPKGEGKDKKQARRNAAKNALHSLSEKENQSPVESKPKVNYRSLLNEYGQKNKVVIKAVETPTQESKNPSPYVVGGKEYPAAIGKTKKEAKEEAAKLAYHEINGSRTTQVSSPSLCEAGEPATLSTPCKRLEFSDDEPNETTDTRISDEMTSFRSTSEFDSIDPLGKGGFGQVFKARNQLLNKFFAIKVVACKDTVKALREVKALCDLAHSNIVRYYASWMDDKGCPWDSTDDGSSSTQSDRSSAASYLYIQMDLCDTKTLEDWIHECNTKNTSLPNPERRTKGLDFIQQIVTGVEYIHSNKFIHRDLKPSNILFKGEGNVKLGDFGLVATEKDHNDENMERTMNKGTPTYMAPEQKSEKTYDRKVDIFALGLIYFELLWKISTRQKRQEVWNEIRGRVFPKDFQDHFSSEYMIIISMLSVTPEHRPEASALLTSLEECKRSFDTQEIKRRSNRTV